MPERKRIRGWIGEQSFEITEGFEHLDRVAEAMVFSAAYRTHMKHNFSAPAARDGASNAVKSFRETSGG